MEYARTAIFFIAFWAMTDTDTRHRKTRCLNKKLGKKIALAIVDYDAYNP